MTHPLILADAERIASRVDLSPLKGKSVLVTGATGLIGTTLCAAIACSGPGALAWQGKTEQGTLEADAYDFIVQAAGSAAPSVFTARPLETLEAAIEDTGICLGHWLRGGGRFLFLSTSEIYSGATPPHRETDIGTATPEHPRAAYIFGKLAGETICHAYRAQGVDARIARVSLAYGPGTRRGDGRVLNEFIEQALTRKQISLRDSGGAVRTYCYVADTVEMLLNVLLHGKQAVYNVGGQSSVSINELAVLIGELTGAAVDWPNTQPDPAAPGAVRLAMTRYTDEFGAPDYVPLREGLRRTIEFQRGLYA